jgi:hypothetical protein
MKRRFSGVCRRWLRNSETRRPIRMPILESIRPYPDNAFGDEEGDGDGEANDATST